MNEQNTAHPVEGFRHTPGPWTYDALRNGNYAIRAIDDGVHIVLAQVFVDADDPLCEPDAALIAAAPELLEACKRAADALRLLGAFGDEAFTRAAIAKATAHTHESAVTP